MNYIDRILGLPSLETLWTFDDENSPVTEDSTGNNSLSLSGGTFTTPLLKDQGGSAWKLSGGSDLASANSFPNLSNGFTIELWFKSSSFTNRTLVDRPGQYKLFFDNNNNLNLSVIRGGVTYSVQAKYDNFVQGRTYYLTATYDLISLRLYLNSSLISESNCTGSLDVPSSILYIGATNGSSNYFSGCLDNIAFYSSCLSSNEISIHYKLGVNSYPQIQKIASQPPPKWRIFLADADTLSIEGEISKAKDIQLQLALNKPGNLSFSISAIHEMAENLEAITKCLILKRDNKTIFSGPIWTIQENWQTITVTSIGWFELLNHRIFYEDKPMASVTLDLAYEMINYTNSIWNTGLEPIIPDYDFDYWRPPYLTPTYKKFQNIGQEIQALSDMENGFDWYMDYDTKQLYITPRKSRVIQDVILGHKWGPHNISNVERTIDGSLLATEVLAIGKSGSAIAYNSSKKDEYGLFTEQVTASELIDINMLQAYAQSELVFKENPRTTYTITPFANTSPSFLTDYDIGDIIYFAARAGRLNIPKQAIRVFGGTINIDINGNEKLTTLDIYANN